MFDIRGLIQVGNRSGQRIPCPRIIKGIVVSNQCHQLHFLHAPIDAGSAENGTQIGLYRIHFVDGQTKEIPIAVGEQLADFFEQPAETGKRFEVVWTGQNELSKSTTPFMVSRILPVFKLLFPANQPAPSAIRFHLLPSECFLRESVRSFPFSGLIG